MITLYIYTYIYIYIYIYINIYIYIYYITQLQIFYKKEDGNQYTTQKMLVQYKNGIPPNDILIDKRYHFLLCLQPLQRNPDLLIYLLPLQASSVCILQMQTCTLYTIHKTFVPTHASIDKSKSANFMLQSGGQALMKVSIIKLPFTRSLSANRKQ